MNAFRYGLISVVFACIPLSPVIGGDNGHDRHKHAHESHKHEKTHDHNKHEKGHNKHGDKKDHGAHEHGVSQLNIAVSGKRVEIEFTSPGVDIVGFEHKPNTDAQRERVRRALAKLRQTPTVIELPSAARCEETKTHAHLEQESKDHAEFSVFLHFTCENPGALDHLEVTAFSTFPNIKEINAQAITPNGQFAAELTSQRRQLTLR